jgi:DNA-binding Xre family transcriptional regulator
MEKILQEEDIRRTELYREIERVKLHNLSLIESVNMKSLEIDALRELNQTLNTSVSGKVKVNA